MSVKYKYITLQLKKGRIIMTTSPNARYVFDFNVFPTLIFGTHSEKFIRGLIKEREKLIAKLMNDFYKDFATNTNTKFGKKDMFAPKDFRVSFDKLDDKGTMLLSMTMPEDNSGGISYVKHLLVFDMKKMKPRLFTVEKSDTNMLKMFADMFGKEMLENPQNHLCELRPNSRSNYGYAPENEEELKKRILEIYMG